jgi:hypothetical protein
MEITNSLQLQAAIADLKLREAAEKEALVEQWQDTLESLKPANLIKSAMNRITGGKLTDNVMDAAIGVGAGLLSKKILVGRSGNVFKKILGNVVEVGVANLVANNAGKISGGLKSIGNFFKKKAD